MSFKASSTSYVCLLLCLFLLLVTSHGFATTTTTSTPLDAAATTTTTTKAEQEKALLLARGVKEEALMAKQTTPMQPPPANANFAQILQQEGVVRIDQALKGGGGGGDGGDDDDFIQCLRRNIIQLAQDAQNDVAQGRVAHKDRFAKCLLSDHRCDLLLPLQGIYRQAVDALLLDSVVGSTIQTVLGKDATLYELSCLISQPGSARQNIHPDHPIRPDQLHHPSCITCFVALQDVTPSMGPTVFLPRTHNDAAVHDRFQRRRVEDEFTTESPKDALLRTTKAVSAVVPAGTATLYDSRLLHCGSANRSTKDATRALFYVTFKHAKVDFPGNKGSLGYGLDQAAAPWTLRDFMLGRRD